ncbi:hypothetical protein CTI12_AA128360 [Artemisia annua]|uniref:non-specific serine/threonine protein kinase n=1 Tax=Artemisia annua TaxID=35608 RepID=A0A2U1PP79_ARTAN|nr:hypothetical protein CTI12_AA128360 [Artemisia annua]
MKSRHLVVNLLILALIRECSSNQGELYGTCDDSFSCGNISGFKYPFRRHQDPVYCGYPGFELNCDEENPPIINITNINYRVLSIDPTSQILKIMQEDMTDSICPQDPVNTTIDNNLFSHTSKYMNISYLFGCPVSFDSAGYIGSIFCNNNGVDHVFLSYGARGPGSCKTSVILPVPDRFMAPSDLGPFVHQGFEVKWNVGVGPCTDCMQSGGQCMYSNVTSLTTCACPEPPFLADSCLSDNKTRVSSSPSSEKSRLCAKQVSCILRSVIWGQ